jgi:hypothetical protein
LALAEMLLWRDPEKAAATLEQLKRYVLEVMATKVIRGGNGCSALADLTRRAPGGCIKE